MTVLFLHWCMKHCLKNAYWLKHDIYRLYTGLYVIIIKNFREKFLPAKNGISYDQKTRINSNITDKKLKFSIDTAKNIVFKIITEWIFKWYDPLLFLHNDISIWRNKITGLIGDISKKHPIIRAEKCGLYHSKLSLYRFRPPPNYKNFQNSTSLDNIMISKQKITTYKVEYLHKINLNTW